MNLREKTVARSYEEITADAEKYILAAINAINDKEINTLDCKSIALGGDDDGNHTHILVDHKSKVVVDVEDENIKITLDDTGESVILNEKDAQEVKELFLDPLRDLIEKKREEEKHPACGLLGSILVMPLVIQDLKEQGKNPMDITPREMKRLIDEKTAELMKED